MPLKPLSVHNVGAFRVTNFITNINKYVVSTV
jgi:hypothetical protein